MKLSEEIYKIKQKLLGYAIGGIIMKELPQLPLAWSTEFPSLPTSKHVSTQG